MINTPINTPSVTEEPTASTTPPSWRAGFGIAVVAAAAATAVWALWTQAAGVELEAEAANGTQTVTLPSVIFAALLVTLAGTAVLRWWVDRAPRGRHRWTILALAVTVVSMLSPAGAATTGAGLGIATLHLTVAAVVIIGLRRTCQ